MKVECTWGDGPDIILDLEDKNTANNTVDLTCEEALQLAHALLCSCDHVRELERLCEDHDKSIESLYQQWLAAKDTAKPMLVPPHIRDGFEDRFRAIPAVLEPPITSSNTDKQKA